MKNLFFRGMFSRTARGLTLFAFLTAPAVGAQAVQISASADVERCQFLAAVEGMGSGGKMHTKSGDARGQQQALEQAEHMGATHMVWKRPTGIFHHHIRADAYKCGAATQQAKVH